MTPERLRQVANVLDVVLELDDAMRSSYLDVLGAEDPELQQVVEDHLRQITGDGAEPAGEAEQDLNAGREIGSRLGPYRILEHLGVGGMGSVYLAQREDEQFERRVAVKVLRAGFDTPELIRRFVAERQILARLEHPHIARLYGGGTTADGRPYLAMEYVAGLPIDRFCDEEKLGVSARLELMCKVCRAVQYAHRHLIVHRDLKPSNILVDAEGEPRLLDFGVAKLLDPASFPMTIEATRTGLSPMTPHYASPEQVSGGTITTATDVYALGVLLYRLLAGRLPYHFESASRDHILGVLERSGPTRPSQVIVESTTEDTRETGPEPLPALLGVTPAELQRQIEGDLDSIALKALRPEPEHRYASAEQMAVDIERHQDGRPVLALQGTWRYRMGKFIRRHRYAAALAGGAVALLAVLAVFMSWQAAKIAEERNAALAARDEARTAQQAEAQVVEFLTGLFKNADPQQARGREITARELLESGAERVRSELTDRPAVQARLLLTMSEVYHQLNLFEQSVDLAAESARLRERLDASPEEIAKARLAEANGLLMLGRFDESSAVLDRIEEVLGAEAANSYSLPGSRGLIAVQQGRFEEAAELLALAIERHEQSPSPDPAALARTLSNLGYTEEQLGLAEKAEQTYRKALELARRELGEDHPMVATGLNNLGACLKDQGRIEEATDAYRQALALRVRLLGEDHLQTAQTRANLAILDAEAGRWREAVPAFQRTIEAFAEHLGAEHAYVAMARNNLGQCYRQLGEHALAKEALDRALEAVTASVGAEHPIAAQNFLQQAALEIDRGRIEAAEPYLQRAETVLERAVGTSHRLFNAVGQGRCRAAAEGGAAGAVERCEQALAAHRESYGETHRSSLAISADLVRALLAAGDIDEALARLEEAEKVAAETTDAEHPGRIPLLLARGDLHRMRGETAEARAAYARAVELADLARLTEAHAWRRHAERASASLDDG